MNRQAQKTGSIGILITIGVASAASVLSWIGYNASQVPTLEATFKSEIQHLNRNLQDLTKTAQKTNGALENYTKYHAANLAKITEAIVTQRVKLDDFEKRCDRNENMVLDCRKETDQRFRVLHDEINDIQAHDKEMEEAMMKAHKK